MFSLVEKREDALTGKSLELMNFTAIPAHPPLLPTLHEKSNAFSVSSGRNSTWWSDPETNTAVRRQQTSFFDMLRVYASVRVCVSECVCLCVWRLSPGLLVWCM